ncbi:MAG TPA: hypothetical protein VLK84_03380 [Longimicrobium sp.]|nr:hypothetical protein [Longimicrobium sp.]
MNEKLTLNLDALKVESMEMPPAQALRAVTTSQTCPTLCFHCSTDC